MSKRILIIDDEDDIREILELSLQHVGGWQTLAAACAAEGLERARTELPDAILLDVMMPDMDGVTALACLKADKRTAGIPVILMTATVQIARGMQARQSAGVILKPFDPLTLARQISEMLGWNSQDPTNADPNDSQKLVGFARLESDDPPPLISAKPRGYLESVY